MLAAISCPMSRVRPMPHLPEPEMALLQRPQPRPGVLAIDPYVPGKSSAPGVARVFKLSSNKTPLGPSPKAIAAYKAVGEHLQDYPDGAATDLRVAIGRAF